MQNNRPYDGLSFVLIDVSDKRINVIQIIRNRNSAETITKYSVDGNDYVLTRTHPALADYARNFPYPVFALWSQNSLAVYSHERIYDFKVTVNGILTREFIPVRKDGIGYMYDVVSEQLFGNEGTGDFILGPDIE